MRYVREVLKTCADLQLHRMIQEGRYVEECKDEWLRRWKLPYPSYKTADGIKKYVGS